LRGKFVEYGPEVPPDLPKQYLRLFAPA
jgi:hypothetical protein